MNPQRNPQEIPKTTGRKRKKKKGTRNVLRKGRVKV